MEKKNVLLSVDDLSVKFRVRGRTLTAIRGISLDIYENESIAIVGESGSGKSVFTKTFAGMLDSNGFISNGHLLFNDDELAETNAANNDRAKKEIAAIKAKLDEYAKFEVGCDTYHEILALRAERDARAVVSDEEREEKEKELQDLRLKRADIYNARTAMDRRKEGDKIREAKHTIAALDAQIKEMEKRNARMAKEKKDAAARDTAYLKEYASKRDVLRAKYNQEVAGAITAEAAERNVGLAKEIYLSVARYDFRRRKKMTSRLLESFRKAMKVGINWNDELQRNDLYSGITPRVCYEGENETKLMGRCVLDLAAMKYSKDWCQVRGGKIATVFQDPMTSLNPIITIGKQITSVILKHQDISESEARIQALDLMRKVGIPNAEARFDDYPFQYSGGMRQRIVIAIALSCRPKILICDEPTTALDVTIQAQILKLIKDLQKEFGYTIVFITHDLGVVANIADRVAVLYAGQVIELGTVEDVFYEPKHPYTWALLSSLPQLAERNTKLYSITGTPPSLYNNIVGDAFAPRNPYCLKIDTLLEPPMFQVSETHFAKTWLLDENAPKIDKPDSIQDIHEKLVKAFNI